MRGREKCNLQLLDKPATETLVPQQYPSTKGTCKRHPKKWVWMSSSRNNEADRLHYYSLYLAYLNCCNMKQTQLSY